MRVVLIDSDPAGRAVLARRLAAQGYTVVEYESAAEAGGDCLAYPPAAVIADLWMSGVSGIQLCRLLRSEPATSSVPVILRAADDTPRTRFWSRHAGASGYVARGRFGELIRCLSRVARRREADQDGFFFQLPTDVLDIRDRIAERLDEALFDSVLTSEVRALDCDGDFERLFDRLSQLLAQVTRYRWMALSMETPQQFGVHCRPRRREGLRDAVAGALGLAPEQTGLWVEDDDTDAADTGVAPLVADIRFGGARVGRIALAPGCEVDDAARIVELVARELGGALRIVALVAQTLRLAEHDTLTGALRRAPFLTRLGEQLATGDGATVLLLDLDHFKSINDRHGHPGGDRVLQRAAEAIRTVCGDQAEVARWGGEEFLVSLPGRDVEAASALSVSILDALRGAGIQSLDGTPIPVTASIGVAIQESKELPDVVIARADAAMYRAKSAGRDQFVLAWNGDARLASG